MKKKRGWLRVLALVSQLGICMLTAIFFCVLIGNFLVERFHRELLFPAMLVLGILAGLRSCYTVIQRFVDLNKNTSPQHYIEEIKKRKNVETRTQDSEEET
ncbi:MAG: AtpZ/AtpI family protein [Eubacteriales bacterium]|nr:AtpZ/AtpI family protein [Eubacteriales bacterium]